MQTKPTGREKGINSIWQHTLLGQLQRTDMLADSSRDGRTAGNLLGSWSACSSLPQRNLALANKTTRALTFRHSKRHSKPVSRNVPWRHMSPTIWKRICTQLCIADCHCKYGEKTLNAQGMREGNYCFAFLSSWKEVGWSFWLYRLVYCPFTSCLLIILLK